MCVRERRGGRIGKSEREIDRQKFEIKIIICETGEQGKTRGDLLNSIQLNNTLNSYDGMRRKIL